MLKIFVTLFLIIVLSVLGLNTSNTSALIVIFSIVVFLGLVLEKMFVYEKKKYQFIAVLHPKIEEEVKDRFKALNDDFFQYYDTTDLNPLFAKADIMLSDTTSAISEFVMQKKVVVTYKNNRPEPHFMNITELSHLEEALDYALTCPEEIILEINKFIDATHPYQDGKSSERIVNACISFVHKDKSYLKKKPLNLIRKWKIRKKLKYFTLKSYNLPFTLSKPKL